MALSPWAVLAGGRIRTDAEEQKRRETGEKGSLSPFPLHLRSRSGIVTGRMLALAINRIRQRSTQKCQAASDGIHQQSASV